MWGLDSHGLSVLSDIEPGELFEPQVTNQNFCVISMGKRKREMIFFKGEA